MTRNLFIAAILLFVITLLGIIFGVVTVAPGAMFIAVLCTFPSFLLIFGAALGRASNEFEIVNKQRQPATSQNRVVRTNRSPQELMS